MAPQSVFDADGLNRLLLRLDPDRANALTMYGEIRRTLVKVLVWNRSSDAEELADETLARVAAKLDVVKVENIRAFALGVARNVCLEDLHKSRLQTSTEEIPGGPDALRGPRDPEREIVYAVSEQIRLACLRSCCAKLETEDRSLVISYYGADGEKQKVHRKRLAVGLRITMNVLRVRAHRLREELEECVRDCLETRRQKFVISSGGIQR